jgi:HD superfamily phosphohydrolase
VSYGHFDLDWTIDNLAICILNDQAFLGINERAVSTFDDFLLCRYHMFVMVYFHYKSVCLENLLARFFNTSDEYKIPADIENYQDHDDHFLMNILRKSKNKYAQNIVENKIPTKLYESFNQTQVDKLNQLENYMIEQKIEYIKSSSKGRLSKYYVSSENNQKNSIKVLKSYPSQSQPNVINIDQATDLFAKYSSTHSINRIHCWKSELQAHQLDFINQVITQ